MPFLPIYYMPEEACFGDKTRSMKVAVGKQRLAAAHMDFLTFLFVYCDATA
jgi:hypothetical protein